MRVKLFERALAAALALTLAVSCTFAAAASEDIPNRVLRLHVIANSDSNADQALKRRVRDRILTQSGGWMASARSREEAQAAARAHLPALKRQAEEELRAYGCSDPVAVSLTDCWFPTREYESVTLPAGTYRALRVVIGKGKGHNWWCVLFPALCLPSAQPQQELSGVLTSAEQAFVGGNAQGGGQGYQVKFKAVELYEQFRNWVQGLGK